MKDKTGIRGNEEGKERMARSCWTRNSARESSSCDGKHTDGYPWTIATATSSHTIIQSSTSEPPELHVRPITPRKCERGAKRQQVAKRDDRMIHRRSHRCDQLRGARFDFIPIDTKRYLIGTKGGPQDVGYEGFERGRR